MKIAVLTSGGDAPGMNAALRTISVVGSGRGHEVIGVRHGYAGLLRGDVVKLDAAAVDGRARGAAARGAAPMLRAREREEPRSGSRTGR